MLRSKADIVTEFSISMTMIRLIEPLIGFSGALDYPFRFGVSHSVLSPDPSNFNAVAFSGDLCCRVAH